MDFHLVLLFIVALLSDGTLLASARSPPSFGPGDRAARAPASSSGGGLRVKTTLDIFLLQLLPLKAQTVLRNVHPACAKALTPLIDECYGDYELQSRYTVQLRGTAEELKVGCCNLWKYHSCVIGAVERLSHYSFAHCTEDDAEAAEEVLTNSESIPRSKLMCADYHSSSFYCSAYFEPSLALTLVLVLGFVAILVAACLAGFMFYLSTLRVPHIIYIKGRSGYHNDGHELLDFDKDGQFKI